MIVRTGSQVGRLYVCREAVAWVTCDTVRTRLRDILEEDAGIDREALNAVVGECQHTRKNFGETLLDWGLLDEETLRGCLLRHNATHFLGIIGLGRRVESMFVPRPRQYSGSLLFRYEELVAHARSLNDKHSSILPPASDASTRLSEVYLQIPDCRALVVVDSARRLPVAVWPPARLSLAEEVVVTETALHMLQPTLTPFGSASPPPNSQRDVIIIGDNQLMVVRQCGRDRVSVALCQDMRNLGMSMGMARSKLGDACALELDTPRQSLV